MKRIFVCVAVVALFAASAAAADTAWGLRGGLTFDPDQVHLGAHLEAGELFTQGYFVPNVEIGFGDHITTIAFNPELVYRFLKRSKSNWGFYAGGGLGINYYKLDVPEGFRGDDSDTELGLNILGGMSRKLSSGNEFFVELKLGVTDEMPDAKITAGLTFF